MAKVLIGGDREPDMVAALARFDGLHRRREIANVEASFEALRNPGAQQVDLQAVALLTNVDRNGRIVQGNDHAAGIVVAAPKVDVADAFVADRAGRRSFGDLASRRFQHDVDLVAVLVDLIVHHLAKPHHDARASARFGAGYALDDTGANTG